MPTFRLGNCAIDLAFAPLDGPLALPDRQLAWRLVLELVARPALRSETANAAELSELVSVLRHLLAEWPAAQVEKADPGHLGMVSLAVIEFVLMPCVTAEPLSAEAWQTVRAFLQAWAGELVRSYHFGDIGTELPPDIRAAWQALA